MTIGTKRQECSKIIIGAPDRDNFRIISRDPQMSEAEYQRMLGQAAGLDYDIAKLKRVPQSWLSLLRSANENADLGLR